MKLNFVNHAVKFSEDDIRIMDEFEIGNYKIRRVSVFKGQTMTYENITVHGEGEYVPSIYYDNFDAMLNGGKPKFEIQTSAYGAKGVDDIQKIIAGYEEAVEVVKVLTKRFC